MVVVVGAGGGGATILNVLVHAVQEPQVCILRLETKWRGERREDRGKSSVNIAELQHASIRQRGC